jgi:magnesium-protoporphyrin IX monomethyl ester (oxidative) cyclase
LVLIGEDVETTRKVIDDIRPDWILVSILFSNLAEHGKTIAKIAKEVNPNIKTVLGGNHVNNTYEDILNQPYVDFVVLGECDFTVGELINTYHDNGDVGKIKGVAFKQNNSIHETGKSLMIHDLDSLPKEARELMDMESYFEVGLFHSAKSRSKRVGNIMATRGCPEMCTFCTTPEMWGNVVRWRSPQVIYEEIKELVDVYKVEEIQFDDDTLTANRKRLLELCDLIEPLKIQWCTPNGVKVNYHSKNPEMQDFLYRRMYESGCYQITFGVESGSQEILDHTINKRLPLETVKPAVESAKKAGMLVHTFFMVGFPGETYEQMEHTIKFAEEIEADSYSVAITAPLPGTPLFEEVSRKGLFVDDLSPEEIIDKILFSKSLIKVDGFDDAIDFENWVNEQNIYLNGLLLKKSPERYKLKYGTLETDERMLRRQT